jgi:imidazolonepropionase-like amidohydrolase
MEEIIIKGGTIIDGTGSPPVERDVRIREGIISELGKIKFNKDSKIIKAEGATVMPGLIESHTHPLGERGLQPKLEKYYDNLINSQILPILYSVKVLRELLKYGVTTVRILHGTIPTAEMRGEHLVAIRKAVERKYFPSPRIIAAGCVFPTAGHIQMMSYPTLRRPEWVGADGVDAVRKQTRECLAHGVDVIKLLGPTGGGGIPPDSPKSQGMTLEEIKAAVEEAHWKGIPVSAHAHGGGGLRASIEAGVDTIEHGTWLYEQPDLIKKMKEKEIIFVPTMGPRFHPEYSNYDKALKGELDEKATVQALEPAEAIRKSLRMAHKEGVKIAAGTDFMKWDISPLAYELFIYVREGDMTPLEAIKAGTKTAAEACNLKNVGIIAEGKIADVIIVDGDPSKDITILQNQEKIMTVIKDGVIEVENCELNW